MKGAQGTDSAVHWVPLLPCAVASAGSAPKAALWCESILTLAEVFSFLRYFSYLFPDSFPTIPNSDVRGFTHVHCHSQKPLGIYDKNTE